MKWKLTIVMSLLMTAISLLLAGGAYFYMKSNYLTAINSNRLLVVSNLAMSTFEALLREDLGSIAFLGGQFEKQRDVMSVMVLDKKNKVLYDSRHQLDGTVIKEAQDASYSKSVVLNKKEAAEITVPFKIGETKWASARVVYSMGAINKEIAVIFKTVFLFCLGGIIIGIATSSVLARWITRPIEELAKGINAVEKGDLDYRIRIESHDELERVGNEFNSMSERLKEVQEELLMEEEELRAANHELLEREREMESKNLELQELSNRLQLMVTELEESGRRLKDAQAELMEKEKMAAILELAGAAAHEINQPLTVIIGNIDLLLSQDKLGEEEVRKTLGTINRSARDMADIVKKMAKIRRYETKSYVEKIKILDIDKSSRG